MLISPFAATEAVIASFFFQLAEKKITADHQTIGFNIIGLF